MRRADYTVNRDVLKQRNTFQHIGHIIGGSSGSNFLTIIEGRQTIKQMITRTTQTTMDGLYKVMDSTKAYI